VAKFKFEPISSFWTTVRIVRPDGDVQEFEGQFVYLDDEAWKKCEGLPASEFLTKHWTGWKGILASDDSELPWSAEQRDLFLKHSYISNGVLGAYTIARQGLRAKN
jgi:hypothetical protein